MLDRFESTRKWRLVQLRGLFALAWNFKRNNQPAGRIIIQLEPSRAAVKSHKSSLSVGQTYALAAACFDIVINQAWAIVFYLDPDDAVPRHSTDLYTSGTGVSDRVTHCILHDWLQDQIRHVNVQHFRVDVDFGRESIL